MPTYDFPGEKPEAAFPASAQTFLFYGIEVTRLVGTREEIEESAALYQSQYVESPFSAFHNAFWLGRARAMADGSLVDVYELILLRKVASDC